MLAAKALSPNSIIGRLEDGLRTESADEERRSALTMLLATLRNRRQAALELARVCTREARP
jgi:hypothetical protein